MGSIARCTPARRWTTPSSQAFAPVRHHPLRRARERVVTQNSPKAPMVGVRERQARARHLLRRDDHVRAVGRQGRGRPSPASSGRADIVIAKESPLLAGLGEIGDREPVWMSHGDKITAIPLGFEVVATSSGSPYAVIADEGRRLYGVQFHPEVVHTPRGALLIRNFVRRASLG